MAARTLDLADGRILAWREFGDPDGWPLVAVQLDDVHTPAMARFRADHLPNALLVYEPDHATFNFIDDFDTILHTLASRP